jgi:hypothetical protein
VRLFTSLLGLLYTDQVILPLLRDATLVTTSADGGPRAHQTDAIDLSAILSSFSTAYPRTPGQISLLKERQTRKRDTAGLSEHAYGLAAPFGIIETPSEISERRRRQAFEDRSSLSLSLSLSCSLSLPLSLPPSLSLHTCADNLATLCPTHAGRLRTKTA